MEDVNVPSGQDIRFAERLYEDRPDGVTIRYRFVAPSLSEVDFEKAAGDMDHLCAIYTAREDVDLTQSHRIVVSLSEKSVAFGTTDASVTQFFEVYSVQEGACHVELF